MSNHPLPKTRALLLEQMHAGLHIGAQLTVSFADGREFDLAIGDTQAGTPMTAASLPVWLSAGKPITAVALAQLQERGQIHFDDPVTKFIPEFAQHGKEKIILRHILTHTAGFRFLPHYDYSASWDQIISDICAMPIEPGWIPGQTAGYHPLTSWFILGEVIHRTDGRPFNDYVREEIFLPLDMPDFWIGMPIDRYEQYGRRIALPHQTRHAPPSIAPQWEPPIALTIPRPGSNTTGPARQFVQFYQMLLNHGQFIGRRLLTPASVQELTSPARIGLFDKTFNAPIDWALGFQINTAQSDTQPYSLGSSFSAAAFGHAGNQCSIAFADPATGVSAAIFCNGMPGESAHQIRMRSLLSVFAMDTAEKYG
jgi:CubicO group peptidase (beta-lactamase class C family)